MEKDTIILNDAKNKQKHYAVTCRCGHVGPNNYVEIVFAIIAFNGKEASAKARKIARVKHNKKNAIIDCRKVTREEFNKIIKANKNDPYLKCKNIQEQRLITDFETRIIKEQKETAYKKSKKDREELIKYKLKKQKQLIDSLTHNCSIVKGVHYYESNY